MFKADDLKHATNKIYEVIFNSENDLKEFLKNSKNNTKFNIVDIQSKKVVVNVDDKNINYLIEKLSKFKIVDFVHNKETLEDYFMKYYKEDKNFGGAL